MGLIDTLIEREAMKKCHKNKCLTVIKIIFSLLRALDIFAHNIAIKR